MRKNSQPAPAESASAIGMYSAQWKFTAQVLKITASVHVSATPRHAPRTAPAITAIVIYFFFILRKFSDTASPSCACVFFV